MLALVWACNLKTKQRSLVVIITAFFKSSHCRVIPFKKEKKNISSPWLAPREGSLQLLAQPRSLYLFAGNGTSTGRVTQKSALHREPALFYAVYFFSPASFFAGWFPLELWESEPEATCCMEFLQCRNNGSQKDLLSSRAVCPEL